MGAHMEGDRTLYEADMTIPTVIVIGNEGKGISRVVKEACDFLVTIPMYGNLNSFECICGCCCFLCMKLCVSAKRNNYVKRYLNCRWI